MKLKRYKKINIYYFTSYRIRRVMYGLVIVNSIKRS